MSVLIKRRHPNAYKDVERLQNELKMLGHYAGAIDGVYGEMTEAAVKRFQNLKAILDDGIVGPITWGRLFPGEAATEALERSSPKDASFQARCIERLIANCRKYVGLREIGNTNRGPKLDEWARALGKPLGIYWCMSAVQGIFAETAKDMGCPDPLKPDTAGCLDLWNRVPDSWKVGPHEGRRGDIPIWDHGDGAGHTGIAAGYGAGLYSIFEGNTNDDGSRNGYEFCEKTRRANDPKLKGFIRVPWNP